MDGPLRCPEFAFALINMLFGVEGRFGDGSLVDTPYYGTDLIRCSCQNRLVYYATISYLDMLSFPLE